MYRYREASAADVPAMARCRLADPAAGPGDTRMTAYFEGRHHPQRALRPRTGYVALDGDAVAGYVAGHLTRRYDCDGEVQYLFVAPQHRRAGVASELLRLMAAWFAEHDAFKVCVNVDVDSPGALPFYARHGAQRLSPHWMIWSDVRVLARTGEGAV